MRKCFKNRWVGLLKIMMYLTINGQFENSHGTLFLLPWLVDDEVNGKPKKLMCRAATQTFFWAEKRSAASRKVSACTRKIFTHFLNGVFCTTVKKWRLPIWYKSLASFVDLTPILTRIRTVNFQMGDHEKCIELIDRVLTVKLLW